MARLLPFCGWGTGFILMPEQRRFDHLCQRVSASLTAASLTPEDVLATLPEARERVYTRRYPKRLRALPDVRARIVPLSVAASERPAGSGLF